MSIIQLNAGERHTFALSALRIQLTGTTAAVATLSALDQAGGESVDVRLGPTEVVMTPQPRRLRLVARPSAGSSFPAGTTIGLTLFTEGASSMLEQVLVTPYDAGALETYELGVLEFATDRSVLTVSGTGRLAPKEAQVETTLVSSTIYDSARTPAATPVPAATRVEDHTWLRAGRYALRDAGQLGTLAAPSSGAWAVVLDGSISMFSLQSSGALPQLLELVCGTVVSWTDTWPSRCVLTGATTVDVPEAVTSPRALCAALEAAQPWSSGLLAPAVASAARTVGAGGMVLAVTDGAPSDVQVLADLARQAPDRLFRYVATGTSAHGLPSDQEDRPFWHEELGGFDALEGLPNVSVAAIRTRADDTLQLDGRRVAELALRLTAATVMTR